MDLSRKKLLIFFRKEKLRIILLTFVFFAAFLLRIWYLPQKAISFAYDQGRDAFIAQEILAGDFKILGPSVSGVPGLYHGVLYYYFLAIPYYFGDGDPVTAGFFFSFVGSLAVFLVFWLSYILSRNFYAAFLSALFFAFSFEATQYANLLTNVTLALIFVPIIYIGLYYWIGGKNPKASLTGAIFSGTGLGLSTQSEFALLYHLFPIAIWLFLYRKKIKTIQVIGFALAFVLCTLTMILVEFKFGFQGVRGILYLLTGQDDIASNLRFTDLLIRFIKQIKETWVNNTLPMFPIAGTLISIIVIGFGVFKDKLDLRKKIPWNYFLLSSMVAHLFVLPFGGSNMRHIMVGTSAAIASFLGLFTWKYLSKNKTIFYIFILSVVFSNLYQIVRENKNGQTIFPLQQDLVLSKELEAIDYTYKNSNGNEFSINTLTSPLYTNTLWSYLYNWYGKSVYGYLPSWTGRNQIGQLGNNLPGNNPKLHYYIIEPTYGIPELYVILSQGEEDSKSILIEQQSFGDIKVQKRLLK